MSELSTALSNPATGAAITAFARTALAATAAAVLAPEIGTIVAVAGAYVAVGAAYYAWKQAQNDALQVISVDKFCAVNSSKPECKATVFNFFGFNGNGSAINHYSISAPYGFTHYKINLSSPSARGSTYYTSTHILNQDGSQKFSISTDGDWQRIEPVDRRKWKDWTAAEREAAIRNLSDADWNKVLADIASSGTLQPGQSLSNDVITLSNAQVQPAGTRALTSAQHELREAIKPELDKLNSDVAKNAAAIAAIAGTLGLAGATIGNIDKNIANLGNVATQTRQAVDNVASKVDAAKNEMNDNFNKVKKRLSGIASFLNIDRILNILIWWQTLHNAFMLSADVGRSLVSAFSTVLKALPGDSLLGLPTESEDGSPLDLATTINSSVETWIKGAIGAENYVQMKTSLAEINRIYQSVTNATNLMLSAAQATQSMVELVGERAGRIGNAMKRFGVVGERAYGWMSENMNARTSWFNRLQERISNTQEVVSSVEQIAGSVISVQESVNQLKTEKTQIETSLEKLEVTQPKDNELVKASTDKERENSQSPEITDDDLQKPEIQQT